MCAAYIGSTDEKKVGDLEGEAKVVVRVVKEENNKTSEVSFSDDVRKGKTRK